MTNSNFERTTLALAKLRDIHEYSAAAAARKGTLHRLGHRWLRHVAELIGIEPGTYDVRSNRGGIAVSGDVALHGEGIYLQLNESCVQPGISVLARSCKGLKDYTGGPNTFFSLSALAERENMDRFLGHCRKTIHSGAVAA